MKKKTVGVGEALDIALAFADPLDKGRALEMPRMAYRQLRKLRAERRGVELKILKLKRSVRRWNRKSLPKRRNAT